jgi:hypothetical protein
MSHELPTKDPDKYAIGVRVIVVCKDEVCFDDYDIGDTAIIRRINEPIPGHLVLRVDWDKPRYPDDESKEAQRCDSLYAYECEPIGGVP